MDFVAELFEKYARPDERRDYPNMSHADAERLLATLKIRKFRSERVDEEYGDDPMGAYHGRNE